MSVYTDKMTKQLNKNLYMSLPKEMTSGKFAFGILWGDKANYLYKATTTFCGPTRQAAFLWGGSKHTDSLYKDDDSFILFRHGNTMQVNGMFSIDGKLFPSY